jgi:hypothetical protein
MRKNIMTSDSKHLDIVPVSTQVLNEILRERLLTSTVHFSFTKKDGTLRDAFGTLKADKITTPAGESSAPNPAVGTYFDIEANGWRSYIIANLVAIY